ncbi:MAG: phage tail tube protein [Methermicoccaceae archaeon]
MAITGNQPVEYVDENTFATTPNNPAMQWFGLVEQFTPYIRTKTDDIRYLRANGEEALESLSQYSTGQELELSFLVRPQSLQFWIDNVLGSATGTDDTLTSISVGHIVDVEGTPYYGLYRGCVVRSAILSFAEDRLCELSFVMASADYSGYTDIDYVGSGSHALRSTSAPLGQVDSLTWGAEPFTDYVRELTIGVHYTLRRLVDIDAQSSTRTVAFIPAKRNIIVSLTMDFASMDMLSSVANLTSHDMVFTMGSNTITIKDVAFPEFKGGFSADDLVETTLTSVPCKSITVA